MNNRVQQKEQLVINDLVAQVSHRPLWVILYDSSFMSNHSKITHLGCEYCSTIAPKLCCWSINWPFLQFDVHDSFLWLTHKSSTHDVITILLVPLLVFTTGIFRYLLHHFLCNKQLFTRKQKIQNKFMVFRWMTESSDYPSVVERYYQRYSWVSKNQFKVRTSGPRTVLWAPCF